MAEHPAVKPMTFVVGLLVLVACIAAAVAMLRTDPYGDGQTVQQPEPIDEALIGYVETAAIDLTDSPVGAAGPAALAVAQDGTMAVGGGNAVCFFGPKGERAATPIRCSGTVTCLAVVSDDNGRLARLFVGAEEHVEVYDAGGRQLGKWNKPAENAMFASIAATEENVFAADSINRVVWRYDTEGTLLGKIGARDPQRKIPGFIITNLKHFDIAVGPDGMLYVVNPRLLRVEAYTFDGDLRSHWGESSTKLEGFCGCCNPAHLAALSNGSFVTAEKGLVRVKLYSGAGKLQTVVAGPQHLTDTPADLAVDRQGRVLVLDAARKRVRVFEPRDTSKPSDTAKRSDTPGPSEPSSP